MIRQGFDEFMNVTLADAEEVWTKKDNKRVELGRILLKGDNIVSGTPPVQVAVFVAYTDDTASHSLQTLIQPAK